MKYKLKINGAIIYDKMTCRRADGTIKYINWLSGTNVELRDGSTFSEDEKDFMLKHIKKVEVVKEVE